MSEMVQSVAVVMWGLLAACCIEQGKDQNVLSL